jgi:arginine-tRNA-protein transferase
VTSETKIRLYQGEEHPCDYLPEQLSSSQFVDPSLSLSTELYSLLITNGFRRSGGHIYRPMCHDCLACTATRLAVSQFNPSRSQRRILKKNKDVSISIEAAKFSDEYYTLYSRYQKSRHAGGIMAESSAGDFSNFLISGWCETNFVEYRLDNKLIAVAVTDILDSGFSAVYTFFEPNLAERSLGVFSVLTQAEAAKKAEKQWLYLGYWIGQCQKMSYKTNYQPLEGFTENHWQPLHQK